MKNFCFILIFLGSAAAIHGQVPADPPTPSASPQSVRQREFGSSLERYKKKQRKDKRGKRPVQNNTEDEDIIKVETDLVIQDVLVTDPQGNVITTLTKDDFVVKENGAVQPVEVFAASGQTNIPRSIVLILDCGTSQAPYLGMSVEAAKMLVDSLSPNDKMAIVTAEMILSRDFTNDKALLKRTLDYLKENGLKDDRDKGKGWHFDTLIATLNEMFDEQRRQRIIIFQGEGNHVIWLRPDKELPYPVSHSTRWNSGMKYTGFGTMSKYGFREVREAIEGSGVTIYSVIPGMQFFGLPEKERRERAKISWDIKGKALGWHSNYSQAQRNLYIDREEKVRTAGQAAMYKTAELSGGNTAIMERPEEAERIYSDILAVIKSRYVLGYYPADRRRDGKPRMVSIEVKGHPEYIITTRKSYIPRDGNN